MTLFEALLILVLIYSGIYCFGGIGMLIAGYSAGTLMDGLPNDLRADETIHEHEQSDRFRELVRAKLMGICFWGIVFFAALWGLK